MENEKKISLSVCLIVMAVILISCFAVYFIVTKTISNKDVENSNSVSGTINKTGSAYKVILHVNYHDWSEGISSKEESKEIEIEKGKNYTIDDVIVNLDFKVVDITDDGIKIKTEHSWSDGEDSSSLLDKKTEFTIEKNNKLTLSSQTMDAGTVYVLSFEKIFM